MQLLLSDSFKKEYEKIKDKSLRLRVYKHLNKLASMPEAGKPLQYNLKGYRSIRIPPFRIIYTIEQDKISVICFDHRKDVYKV
jgi:addiction module RelE/StbE family toxin